ncbi:MAG: AMP-binding protein, partial [Acidobacteriota bacterium]|nr:AMP-binding protein [Acidobacteriota bacterium]
MSSQTQGFRLSPQQRRVWAAREGAAYCCQCAVLLEGRPKTEALKTALGAVVDGHEILRTTFVRAPGMRLPVQVVGEGGYAWRQADLSRRAAEPTEDLADELLREERGEPFDPARGPCLRAALFTLEPERHLLLLTLPSLCADARTLHNLARAVGDAYASGSGAADVAVQYVEFAEWQNEVLEDEQGKAGRQFWQNPADADPHPSSLPLGVGARRYAPASVGVEVGPEVRAKLERAAARLGVSRAAFLLACWQTLLSRLTDARPLVVGMVFDGRKYEELGDAVGPFAKRLPVEANVGADARFSEVAAEAARALGEAGDWQEYFDPAATESEADAPAGVFGFAFEEWPAKFSAGGLAFSIVRQYVCFDPRQVELVCAAQGGDLTAELLYDAGAVERERALLLASQFAALLESAAERPEAPVAGLNFLSEGERGRLLYEWNATRVDYPSDVPVHRLFEEQAARTPGATAVVYADTRLSYAELNESANRLARRLLKHGVERDGPVGLFVERTPEMVVGLLGIMKAGAAYVPLDPTHPPQRLGFMLEDAGARLVVAQRKLADALPPHGLRVLFLDAGSVADESGENVGAELSGDNLAYVIYTSGSTGKPKGVAVTHRGLSNYLHWCTRAYDAAGGEGSPVHSPLGFDLTVTSLFTPLLAGRAVVLIPEEAGVEGLSEALLASVGFSLVKITPPHLEVLNYLLPAEAAAGRARALV